MKIAKIEKAGMAAMLAAALVAVGVAAADRTPRQHDVIILQGITYVYGSSSSSNAPRFPEFDWTNYTGAGMADAIATGLDHSFELKSDFVDSYGMRHVLMVRAR